MSRGDQEGAQHEALDQGCRTSQRHDNGRGRLLVAGGKCSRANGMYEARLLLLRQRRLLPAIAENVARVRNLIAAKKAEGRAIGSLSVPLSPRRRLLYDQLRCRRQDRRERRTPIGPVIGLDSQPRSIGWRSHGGRERRRLLCGPKFWKDRPRTAKTSISSTSSFRPISPAISFLPRRTIKDG